MELEHAPEGLQLLQSILKNEEYSSLAQGLTECSDVDDFEAFVNRKLEQLLRLFRDLVDDYKLLGTPNTSDTSRQGDQSEYLNHENHTNSVPSVLPSSRSSAEFPDPKIFNGDNLSRDDNHHAFSRWKRMILHKLETDAADFPSETSRVAYLMRFLDGQASMLVQIWWVKDGSITVTQILEHVGRIYMKPEDLEKAESLYTQYLAQSYLYSDECIFQSRMLAIQVGIDERHQASDLLMKFPHQVKGALTVEQLVPTRGNFFKRLLEKTANSHQS